MKTYEYGNPEVQIVLIQPVGEHELSSIGNEVDEIRSISGKDFCFRAFPVKNWNQELSPWKAPAVFGKEDFGDGAKETLDEILKLCTDKNKKYIIGGYSLAALFSIWTVYQTDLFTAVAAASPPIWFPEFIDYMISKEIMCDAVYISLGDKEKNTRNPVISKVESCIYDAYDVLKRKGINTIFEQNQGNHFREPDLRTAKAFAWAMMRIHISS